MRGRVVLVSTMAAAVLAATPAMAHKSPRHSQSSRVTATGTGEARVLPKDRQSNASIVAAVDVAHELAIQRGFRKAREYARGYAKLAGLTLGRVLSVTDVQPTPGYYY